MKESTRGEVDDLTAEFTKGLLALATREGIEFETVGPRGSKTEEVLAVLKGDLNVAEQLLK